MQLFKSIVSVSALTTLSRVAGLAREIVVAKVFGAGAANDAFEIAFQLPNMMRRLFAEGAFAQAFVPLIAEYKGQRGEAATHQLINRVATLQLVSLLAVTAIGIVAAPWLIPLFAAGFEKTPGKTELAVSMLRVMFPYLLFISLTALAGGVMNIWKKFGIPAFTPVLLNAAMIAAALWAAPHFAQPIHALAWGVLAGGVLQLGLQLWPLYRLGMLPRLDFHLRDEGVRRMLKTMAPAVLGVSVAQVSLLINTNYASFFGDGAVSWLKKADRLMELPTALLGVAIGTVILPALGVLRNEGNTKGYGQLLDYGLRFAALATLPAMAVMVVLAEPMVATLYQRGAFTALDTLRTGPAVAAYAVGIVALVWIKILAPAFYAQQDTRTPVQIAVRVLLLTQLFNLLFVFVLFAHWAPHLKHAALALSTSLGAVLNAWWLYRGLRARGLYAPQAHWRRFALQLAVATLVATAAIVIARPDDGWWSVRAATAPTWLRALPWHDRLGAHWVEWRRMAMLGALFALGGFAYLGTLAAFGYRLRDVRR
ncbi:MAG: murein biosynthesis integral membrane protein MurJ [Proteobacteria bacterium]|nr:murein biosynthesis integral membrane protein MurJ [Pseudomonadota bacterium]